jgi:hypothetical protein
MASSSQLLNIVPNAYGSSKMECRIRLFECRISHHVIGSAGCLIQAQ